MALTNTQSFQGIWATSYGLLQLHHIGQHVYGDFYASDKFFGTVEGFYDANRRTLIGTLTTNLMSGKIEFTLDPEGRKFTGQWRWKFIFRGTWKLNGTLASTAKPALKIYPTDEAVSVQISRTSQQEDRLIGRARTDRRKGLRLPGAEASSDEFV